MVALAKNPVFEQTEHCFNLVVFQKFCLVWQKVSIILDSYNTNFEQMGSNLKLWNIWTRITRGLFVMSHRSLD